MENLSAEMIEGKLAIDKNAQMEEMKREFKKLGSGSNTLMIFLGYFTSMGIFFFVTSYIEIVQEQKYIYIGVIGIIFLIQVSVGTATIRTNKRIDLLSKIISNEYQKVNS